MWRIRVYFRNHKITRFFTILFVILCIVYAVKSIVYRNSVGNLSGDLTVEDYEEYVKTLKEVPSDIEGMSQYDKYAMGLDYRTGSDTDKDGLSDKEEIEVYGSDPLKASSSGDLYTDGYKVENGMDLFTSYDYTNDRSFTYNECSEVKLEAKEATDFNATVEDYTGRYALDNWGIDTVYQAYYLYNFAGSISLDISDVLSKNAKTLSDIDIWTYDGSFLAYGMSELKKCNYTESNNVVTLSQPFDSDHSYYIFITPKKTFIHSVLNTNKTAAVQLGGTSDVHYLLVTHFFKPTIFYPEMENEATETAFMKQMNAKFGLDNISYVKSTEKDIQLKYKGYNTTVPFLEFDYDKEGKVSGLKELIPLLPKGIFSYQLFDYFGVSVNANVGGSNSEEATVYHFDNYHTSFDPYEDELPFQNFGSVYCEEGNCVGMSYLACALANTGTFPATGSFGNYEWNFTEDPENQTLMDPGLSDYKSRSFVDEKGGKNEYLDDGLTLGEREFIKMAAACYEKSVTVFDLNAYRINNENGLSWDVAETMMGLLDQGKCITACLLLSDNTGHEIVLYDYYWINDEEMIFRVYDCNIPMNHADGFNLTCDGKACYLQCKKKNKGDGTYLFDYFYWPIEDNVAYCATSDRNQGKYSAIIISDETWTIYNEQ